jgi:ElaB/YqjD/DUF883 family membrane-anchored ribosome-binding protein
MEQIQAEKIPSSVQEVPGQLEAFQATARERAKYLAQCANEAVHNSPWTSVGVGFGVGVIVGALVALAAGSRSWR